MSNWIKMHRKITEWRFYTDANTYRLFTHLLYKAAWKPGGWREIDLSPGQLITGRKALAEALMLSEQEIRTSLDKLKTSREITIKATSKFSIITICKWGDYQSSENSEQPVEQPALQPAANQLVTNEQPHLKKLRKKDGRKIEKDKDFELVKSIEIDDRYLGIFLSWLRYKRERGESYKGKDSVGQAFRRLVKLSGENPATAIEIINHAMASNYAGFFELRKKTNGYNPYTNGAAQISRKDPTERILT